MAVAKLPPGAQLPDAGWSFQGTWTEADQELITQTLSERILHRAQAQTDPWLFIAHLSGYYAHCPKVHEPGYGYREDDAAELADTLWGHYFTLRLGPLVLAASPPTPSTPDSAQPGANAPSPADLRESLEREWQALDHFQNALAHIAAGEYAAAKREMQLSFGLYPANSFYSYRRVETLGDIESYLGDDTAAEQHYERALALSMSFRETWADTELRLKLAWCALRKQRFEQARAHIDAALAQCELGRGEHGGSRSLNYVQGLALATMADLYLHQLKLDAALLAARDAAKMASRLGQSYGEKARLYTYLAWQLYLHGETAEARALAKRAWVALDQWLPIESAQTQAMRTTLTTVLGGQIQRPGSTPTATLPSFTAMVATALAAARKMESWSKQAWALHALAPYLEPDQVQPPFDDIIVWGEEDRRFFAPYRILLEADLALAIKGARKIVGSTVKALVRLEPDAFTTLIHEPLYAETLLRLRIQVEPHLREMIVHCLEACATTWGNQIGSSSDDRLLGPVEGLAVLLPHIQEHTKSRLIGQIEARLLKQIQGQNYSSVFLAALPVLARLGAGDAVFEAVVKAQPRSTRMWIACLAHAVAFNLDELRRWIVETALGTLKRSAPYGSTTDIAEIICHLAPYLQGDEVHQALTLATPVRAIVPRARALAAVAAALPSEERAALLIPAWQAASRSKNADTIGEALTAIVVHSAASDQV